MHTKKKALILTLLALNSSHAAVQNSLIPKHSILSPYQAYHNMSEEGTASLISGFCREAYEAAQKPIESQTRTATTMPSALIDIIRELVFGPFFYKKSDEKKGEGIHFIKFLGNYLVTATVDRNSDRKVIISDINSKPEESIKNLEVQRARLKSAIMDGNLLFLGFEMGTESFIKVLDTKNDFSEWATVKLNQRMTLPCAQFDPLGKILFSVNFQKIYINSTENFKNTKKLGPQVGLSETGREVRHRFIELIGGSNRFITGDSEGRIVLHTQKEENYSHEIIACYKDEQRNIEVRGLAWSKKHNLLFCAWAQQPEVVVLNTETSTPGLVICLDQGRVTYNKETNIYDFADSSWSVERTLKGVYALFLDDKREHLFVARRNNTIDIYDTNHFKDCQRRKEKKIRPIFTMNPLVKFSFSSCFTLDRSRQILAYTSHGTDKEIKDYEKAIVALNIVFK